MPRLCPVYSVIPDCVNRVTPSLDLDGRAVPLYTGLLLSGRVRHGGLLDGWGRRVVLFPDDGHPQRCPAASDYRPRNGMAHVPDGLNPKEAATCNVGLTTQGQWPHQLRQD